MISEQSRAAHSASAEYAARRALGVLQDAGGTAVAPGHPAAAREEPPVARPAPAVAVAAVRVLGADVLAPYLLSGRALAAQESAAVRESLAALPPARQPPAAPPDGPEQAWVRAWVDWGLVSVLARLDPGGPGVAAPAPPGPPRCADGAPRRLTAGAASGGEGGGPYGGGGGGEGWVPWSLRMGRLASLALPGLDGPVHHAARRGALGLARGAVRAVLRGDFTTAARLTRWLAWLAADGVVPAVDVALLVQDIALRGGDQRCLLDTELARRLLGPEST